LPLVEEVEQMQQQQQQWSGLERSGGVGRR